MEGLQKYRQGVLSRFSGAVLSVLIAFVLLEIGLRVFPSVIPIRFLVDFQAELRTEIAQRRHLPTRRDVTFLDRDDDGPPLWLYKPFAKVINSVAEPGMVDVVMMDGTGFCNPSQADGTSSTIDTVVLGDSFTWCQAVSPADTWASKLSALVGGPVYNLGMSGVGLYEYLQILRKFGIERAPRIVIMNFYEGNDLRDAIRYHAYRERVRRGARVTSESIPCTVRPLYACRALRYPRESAIGRHSYALNLISTIGEQGLYRLWGGVGRKPNFRYRVSVSGRVFPFNPHNTDVDEVKTARGVRAREIDLAVLDEALAAFVNLSRKNGFIPVVTYTPSAHTAYAAHVVFDDSLLGDLMASFSLEQRDYLREKGEDLGYSFVDLTPFMQHAAGLNNADLLFFRTSLHLTQRGHAVVAQTIAQAVRHLKGK